jgi:F-type H+-transporting ATPase subunit a
LGVVERLEEQSENQGVMALHNSILAELNPLEPVIAVPLFSFSLGPWRIVVSNHMFMVAVGATLLLLVVPLAARSPKIVPRGLQNLVESVCVFLRDEMARPILHGLTDKYVSFIWTAFFFVLTLNLLAMVPTEKILCLITGRKNHFGGPATANIWITGALAVLTFFTTHICGIKEQGLVRYLANLAPPVPKWILPLIYPLEVLSALVRPFTLAVRLFANIIAGHMVLATIFGLIFVFKNLGVAVASVLGSVALSFLELLVAFIQAYIFAFLSTLYIGAAVSSEH